MMRGRIVPFFTLLGGAFMAPLFASSHGTDFLQAKVSFPTSERVKIEITAAYSGNPMITDRDQAQRILPDALHLRSADKLQSLTQLAPLILEERTDFDPTSPLPPEAEITTHELLTACWEWQSDSDQIQFEVPKDSKHDVMLWVIDPNQPEEAPKWMMLLGGDTTPFISVPVRSRLPNLTWILTSIALIIGGALTWRKFRRQKRQPFSAP